MRASSASDWGVKKQRSPRVESARGGAAAWQSASANKPHAAPTATIAAAAKAGEAAKDATKRSAWGAVLKLFAAVFSLAGAPEQNPLLPAGAEPGKYYHRSHRSEFSAGVSSYFAHLAFAACSGLPMAPVEQYCRKLDKESAQQAERTELERRLTYDEQRGGICFFKAVVSASPRTRAHCVKPC